jgi:hypothetical protein
MKQNLIIAGLIVIIILLFYGWWQTAHRNGDLREMYMASHKEVLSLSGGNRVLTQEIKASRKDLKDLQKHSDSLIADIATEMKRQGRKVSSMTRFLAELEFDTITNTIVSFDSSSTIVREDSIVYVYPTYSAATSNKWMEYNIAMSRDSSKVFISFEDDYRATYRDASKWWQKKNEVVDIVSLNPYNKIKDAKTISIDRRPKRFAIGPYVGGGVNVAPDGRVYIGGQVGIGLSYKILEF